MKKKIVFVFLLTFMATPCFSEYAKTIDYNKKTDWIIATASGQGTFDTPVEITTPDSFTVINPKRSKNAWRINASGTVVYDTTGTLIPPSPEEAKGKIIGVAKEVYGWSRGDIRSFIKTYAVYEFIDGNNYDLADMEIEDANSADDLSDTEAVHFKDILDGKR